MRTLAVGLLLALGAGCGAGTRATRDREAPPPGWVDRLPLRTGVMCAVGLSGPTLYQPDCIKNAADNARGHLADNISSTIRTVTLDVSDGGGGYFDRSVFVQGSESASTAVLEGSLIEAQWVDFAGQKGDARGCFTLVCIDLKKPLKGFTDSLRQARVDPKTIQKTRANAQAAFDELEQLEARPAR
jgi:hypothetical protein